jgi:hypothetical protein
VALALSPVAVVAWCVTPFAGLALVLPLHCWMLATMADLRPAARGWLALLGVLPGLVIAATYMHELSLGPVDFAWYDFLLVTGGQVGVVMTLVWTAVLGILASVLAIVVAHARAGVLDARPSAAPLAPPRLQARRWPSRGQWGTRATSRQRRTGPRG